MNTPTPLHRRLGDAISPRNERIYDAARALTVALRLVDQLNLDIIAIDADQRGRQRIQIDSDPRGLLKGNLVHIQSANGNRHYRAERYGVEIVWVELAQPEVA